MSLIGNIIGSFFVALGAIWIGQGAGYVGGSFMSGDPKWAIIGAATGGLGVALLIWINIRRLIARR